MSTLKLSTLSNPEGTSTAAVDAVISGYAKAWVNFNGTGTVAIRSAYNVSSITDGGTGIYTANFTTALPDTNYAVTLGGGLTLDANTNIRFAPGTMTTSSVFVSSVTSTTAVAKDLDVVCIAIFR